MAHHRANPDDQLKQIAGILGLPVASFREGAQLEHLSGAVQCLFLLRQIESAEGQQHALAALSRIAGEEPLKRKQPLTVAESGSASAAT